MTSTTTYSPTSSWRLKQLLFWNILGILLFGSLFWTPLWNGIDARLFTLLNQPLKHSETLRLICAWANHSLADWVQDVCIALFYLAALLKTEKGSRKKTGAQLLFTVLYIACTILLINRFVCRDLLKLRRSSPTLVLSHSVYLSDFLPWLPFKIDSTKSFPGDHATTALLFACSYAYLIRGKLAILALVYGAALTLPRLIVGAHWPSDVIVGSGCIVLFSLSWAFCTPLAGRCIGKIERGLKTKRDRKSGLL